MADLHTYKKLPSDPCLSEEKIMAYIDGKLSAAEQHACETHMADCEMCEDAVEGLALVKDRDRLAAPLKTESAPTEGKVVPLHKPNRRLWYAAAAVLVLILGSTFLLNIISSDEAENKDMAYNSEVAMDSVTAAPGEGYADADKSLMQDEELKNDDTKTGKDGPAESEKSKYKVTVTDANRAVAAEEAPVPVSIEAERDVAVDESFGMDDVADGDAEEVLRAKPEAVVTKDQSGKVEDTKEEQVQVQTEKKNKLLEFADGVAGGAKRAEPKQKTMQDGYVAGDRSNEQANAPAVDNVVTGNTNAAPQSPNAGANSQTFDITPADSNLSLSEVNTVAMHDSVAVVDQLELSYQNGLSMLNAGQTANAILMFDKVLANKNHSRYEDAELQKAKALIKANRKEEAKTLLKSIEAKKGKHANEATELLKTL